MPSQLDMKITAHKDIRIYQLVAHGDFYDYKKGGYMLSVLELANARGAINAKIINKILLGGGLLQIAQRLLDATVACKLLIKTDDGFILTDYGRNSLAESCAWSPLYTSIISIGILDNVVPDSLAQYDLHPVTKLDINDDADLFNSIDDSDTPACILNFVQELLEKKKWLAFTVKNEMEGIEGRSFFSLLLPSKGAKMFWNSIDALLTLEMSEEEKCWLIDSIKPKNQSKTPLKFMLSNMEGQKISATGTLNLLEELESKGFHQHLNGAFTYTKDDVLERKVINLKELNFTQLIIKDTWSYRIEGKLAAVNIEQVLQWYFARYFELDAVVEISALKRDFMNYAKRAGQTDVITDRQLFSAYNTWACAPNRAVRSRRSYFLHFS